MSDTEDETPTLPGVLFVVFLEAVVAGASAVAGAGVLAAVFGADWPPSWPVLGAVLGPFLVAFVARLRKRLPTVNEAAGIDPIPIDNDTGNPPGSNGG